ncbi:LOW QUALITY PROTEIN: voltage-gated purine nucleotide uniporter SLC17A9 [Ctenodactylus gundi]
MWHDEAHRNTAEVTQWSRPECQATGTLLLGTYLVLCLATMPVYTVIMSQDFGWNKKDDFMLSSCFWSSCMTQVVGGPGDHIGGEKIILLPAAIWGVITVATLLLTHLGSAHLVFMTSLCVYFPALTSLLSKQVQESEQPFTYSTMWASSQFGTLVIGTMGSLHGWQCIFCILGGLTWVCSVYKCLLNEKDLILALGILAQRLPIARPSEVLWRQLFWKLSVWTIICSQLSLACSFFILLSWLPTFFKETFPHSKGWVFRVLLLIPANLFSDFLSDHLIRVLGLSMPLLVLGVVGVCLLGGYLVEATGSWTCIFNLVAIISNLGPGTFLLFGQGQRVDLRPSHEDLQLHQNS